MVGATGISRNSSHIDSGQDKGAAGEAELATYKAMQI